MALNKLTANLEDQQIPAVRNLQEFDMLDAYSNFKKIDYKSSQGFVPIDYSDKTLQSLYNDYKRDSANLPSIYREVGNTYNKPVLFSRAAEDTVRVTKFLASPKGALFLLAQTGLQLSQPKPHNSDTFKQQTRIFNPAQLLANVPGRAVGLHLPRHGLIGTTYNYEEVTKHANNAENWEDPVMGGRILKVWRELGFPEIELVKPTTFLGKVKKAAVDVRNFLKDNYSGRTIKELSGIGGPNSFFGAGFTDIKSYTNGIEVTKLNMYSYTEQYKYYYQKSNFSRIKGERLFLFGPTKGDDFSMEYSPGEDYVLNNSKDGTGLGEPLTGPELKKYNNYQDISNMAEKSGNRNSKEESTKNESETGTSDNKYNDFRKEGNKDYQNLNYHKKYGIPSSTGTDKIYDPDELNNNDIEDFIKLKFTYVGDQEEPIQFRATIMALSNNFSPEWNSVDYVGRPDSVYVYKGVKRSVSFSFMLAANSVKEMDVIYKKLNQLGGMTTPSYSLGNRRYAHMVGPIIKLRLGNYINNEPGYISSLDFTIEDDYIWDIDRQEPMYIRISLSFDIIGNSTPRRYIEYFGSNVKVG